MQTATRRTSLRAPVALPRRAVGRTQRASLSVEASLLWAAVFVFVASTFWWLTQDSRVPDWDSGWHMQIALSDKAALAAGQLSTPFTTYNTYPPLVHLVGAIAVFVFGVHPMALTIVANVVFVPLFAFGCYGVGKIVAGNRAGLLAGICGLGVPIFVSMMHNFELDPPEAAMVAVTVWALLASRRFEKIGISAVAGILCGLTLLSKATAIVFLLGVIVTAIARGGWRNWRGLLLFGALAAAVGGPWYAYHYNDLRGTFTSIAQLYVNGIQSPPRWSARNFGWYFWNLVNEQALLPLTLAALAGTLIAIRRCVQSWSPDNVLPELLAGAAVSYLAMTYLTHKDPRYTMPVLIYVAVLGTFWIVQVRRRWLRMGLSAAVVLVAVVNFEAMTFGLGGTHRAMLSLPDPINDSMIYPHQLTLYENQGWLRGPPEHDGNVRGLLVGIKRSGFTAIAMDPDVNYIDFNAAGIIPVADSVGLAIAPAVPAPHVAWLLLHTPQPGDPPACRTMDDGEGVYVVEGNFVGFNSATLRNPGARTERFSLVCPGRTTIVWPLAQR